MSDIATQSSSALQEQIRAAAAAANLTQESVGWLIKSLHPAASGVTAGGIPDASYYCTARPDYRARKTFTAPPGAVNSYDALIWSIPGDVDACFVWTAPAGTNFTSADPNSVGVASWVSIQSVVTAPGGGTAKITNTFPPGAPSVLVNATSVRPQVDGVVWRHRYSSVTVEVTAPTTGSQGTLVSSQFPLNLSAPTCGVTVGGSADPRWPAIGAAFTNRLIAFLNPDSLDMSMFSENVLTRLDPRIYAGKAIDGVYVPLRLTGPSQPFVQPNICVGPGTTFATPGGITYPALFTGPVRCMDYIGVAGNSLPLMNRFMMPNGNSGYDNMNCSVTILRGMDLAASFTVKLYVGLDVVVDPLSPLAPVVEQPSLYDPAVLDLYYRLAHQLNSAYPSSYNSLGILASVLAKAIPTVLPMLAPVAEKALDYVKGRFFGQSPGAQRPNPDSVSAQLVRRSRKSRPSGGASSRASSAASSRKTPRKSRVKIRIPRK